MPGPQLADRVQGLHPLEARVTITLWVSSLVLSAMRLMGSELDFLVPSAEGWPGNMWSLGTACLLHGDFLHLAFNLLWLLRLGIIAEAILGPVGMAFFVVFTAFGSGALEWTLGSPYVGLSGMVYGVFGLLWALDRWHPSGRGLMDPFTSQMLLMWFVLCIVLSRSDVLAVANWAHAGGLALGLISGWSLSRAPDSSGWRSLSFPLAASLMLALPLLTTPKPVRFEQARQAFQRGVAALEDQRAAEAEAHFRASLEHVELAGALWNLGVALQRQGRHAEAKPLTERALELDPSLGRLKDEREQ